ncbi:MAG: hypothetical protein P4L84_08980 [Isosphaeraceae bacterium]|nr:hypothetical protein [Isosphaeraceae bacterium]
MATLLVICAALIGQAPPAPRAVTDKVAVEHAGRRIDVYTYRPPSFARGPLLVVFHGAGRNAEQYRDDARALGDRFGMLVAAPRFDEERFSSSHYHRGGLIVDDQVRPRSEWTWGFVPKIVAELRRAEQRPDMPYYLLGHSAGGQFLARMAGIHPLDAERIVAVNPSAYLLPSRDESFPYGFGGLPGELSSADALRRYLAQPLTIYLGALDNQLDESLDQGAGANRQGANRNERGRNIYRAAEQLARTNGWEFRWALVEAAGVGHDHRGMFDSPACQMALFGPAENGRPRP